MDHVNAWLTFLNCFANYQKYMIREKVGCTHTRQRHRLQTDGVGMLDAVLAVSVSVRLYSPAHCRLRCTMLDHGRFDNLALTRLLADWQVHHKIEGVLQQRTVANFDQRCNDGFDLVGFGFAFGHGSGSFGFDEAQLSGDA
jgi:hypothetical protein